MAKFKPPTWVDANKQFRKSVGRMQDGRQAFFWLGSERDAAYLLTEWLGEIWDEHASKRGGWTKADFERVRQMRETVAGGGANSFVWQGDGGEVRFLGGSHSEVEEQQTVQVQGNAERGMVDAGPGAAVAPGAPAPGGQGGGQPAASLTTVETVRAALDAFKVVVNGSSRSPKQRYTLCKLLEVLELPAAINLDRFGFDAISTAIDRQIALAKNGKIAAQTAVNRIATLRQFVGWLGRTDRFRWQAFPDWRNHFTTELKKLAGKRKSQQHAKRQMNAFDVDTLARLYRAGDDAIKTYMLLALNCGMLNKEIATLTPAMVHLAGDRPYAERARHKTHVEARWYLWPETATFLKTAVEDRRRANASPNAPLLVTRNGTALVRANPNNVTIDNVHLTWRRHLVACGFIDTVKAKGGKSKMKSAGQGRGLAFEFIRKYAAQWVRDHHGIEHSEAFLAHAEHGVSASYTGFADWDGLGKTLEAFRRHLGKMFE